MQRQILVLATMGLLFVGPVRADDTKKPTDKIVEFFEGKCEGYVFFETLLPYAARNDKASEAVVQELFNHPEKTKAICMGPAKMHATIYVNSSVKERYAYLFQTCMEYAPIVPSEREMSRQVARQVCQERLEKDFEQLEGF